MVPLRPNYTLFLLKELQKQSINSYGSCGQGQWRLLDDIKTLTKAQGSIVFLVNMQDYADNYKAFIKEIRKQLYDYLPQARQETMENLADVTHIIKKHSGRRRALFLLHDFDALFHNTHLDKRYDSLFFDSINELISKEERFLCITQIPQSQAKIYFKSKEHKPSWLLFKEVNLPALTSKEISDELMRNNIALFSKSLALLIAMVKQHSQPFNFLEYLIVHLKTTDPNKIKFKKQLKKWRELFDKQAKTSWYKRQYYIGEITQALRTKCKRLFSKPA